MFKVKKGKDGKWYVSTVAANGEILQSSEGFVTQSYATGDHIKAMKDAVADDKVVVEEEEGK